MAEKGTSPERPAERPIERRAILLVGPGRAGQGLVLAWHRAGWPVAWVAGRREEPARRLAERVGARALSLQRLLGEGLPGPWPEVLVLAVADRAVAEVAGALAEALAGVPPANRPRYALHLSGALGLEPLAALARLGVATEVFHPLLPLPGGPAAGRDRLAGGYVTVVYAPGQNRAPVGPVLARALGAVAVPWPGATARQLALYHAAATLAANGVTALLWAAEELLRLSGYPGIPDAGAASVGPQLPAGPRQTTPEPPPPAEAACPGRQPLEPGAPAETAVPGSTPSEPAASGGSAPVRPEPAERTGGDAPEAAPGRAPLLALAAAALTAVGERGPLAALTGPIARGDAPTVRRHLQALAALAAASPAAGPSGPSVPPGPSGPAGPSRPSDPRPSRPSGRVAVPAAEAGSTTVAGPSDHGAAGAWGPGSASAVPAGASGTLDPGPAGRYRLAAALILAAAAARPGEPPAGLGEVARLLAADRGATAPVSAPPAEPVASAGEPAAQAPSHRGEEWS